MARSVAVGNPQFQAAESDRFDQSGELPGPDRQTGAKVVRPIDFAAAASRAS
jgi:hypothetical protein